MKLITGPTSSSRNWARGFYTAYPKIDGLYYPSSMTNEPAMVLNERTDKSNALPALPIVNSSLSDPVLLTPLQNAAEDIAYDLI